MGHFNRDDIELQVMSILYGTPSHTGRLQSSNAMYVVIMIAVFHLSYKKGTHFFFEQLPHVFNPIEMNGVVRQSLKCEQQNHVIAQV